MNTVQKSEIEYYPFNGTNKLPFSQAVRVGNMLYLSGILGTDNTDSLVPGGIIPETQAVMERMKSTLEQYGASLDTVVKVTIMIADMKDFPEMNKVYLPYFKKNLPARSTFGANGLAANGRLEIECVAFIP